MADKELNIYQKLAKVRAIADSVTKSKEGHNYSYSDIVEILAKVTAGMDKYGLSLLPKIMPGTSSVETVTVVNTKMTKDGKPYENKKTEYLYKGDMGYVWVNNDNPEETIEIPWFVCGSQADPSQSVGSGLTYCQRYFLINYFNIAQLSELDPDAYRSKQKKAEESEDRAIAEAIIDKFDVILKKYLSDNSDKVDEVKKFICKFAKNADYFSIKEPNLAAKLLEDFQNTYIKGGK